MKSTSLYVCNNSETISVLGRCNGVPDCSDATDEIDCAVSAEIAGNQGHCIQGDSAFLLVNKLLSIHKFTNIIRKH